MDKGITFMFFFSRFLLVCSLLVCVLLSPAIGAGIDYTVEIPALPGDLRSQLLSVSDCENLRATPPETEGLLRQRMRNDINTFEEVLKASGYFKGTISGHLDRTVSPRLVSFTLHPGPRFTFAAPLLVFSPPGAQAESDVRAILKTISRGTPYASDLVIQTESAMLAELKKNGFPTPTMTSRKVVADHGTNTVDVEFHLDAGTAATFGQTNIQGLERVESMFVINKLAWKQGAPFDSRKIDATRAALISTGLFRSVHIDPQPDPDAREVVMRLTLKEGPPRSVKTGLWYYSDQGPGISAGWTHRNLLGGGQELNLDTTLSHNTQTATAGLTLPEFLLPRQTLELSSTYEHEQTDVYDTSNLVVSALVRHTFSELLLGAGLTYRAISVEENDLRTFNLISTPLLAELSTTDNLLDPSRGLHIALRMEPCMNIDDSSGSFIFWDLVARHYLPLLESNRLVLATRGRYSLLAGTSRDMIPEDMLLYAGGGGSIRGYAYQYAGDLDAGGNPEGGVTAVDFSMELRWRINDAFGLALFGDGGGSFATRFPNDMSALFWGVGTGIRYYTPIGPLRFDVAVPLERRSGVDAPYQLYVSLGQAF